MEFYQEIAKYYDDIFIPKQPQIKFIQKLAGNPPKQILDIACGTGSYTIKLSELGHTVTGIDLDEQMIKQAKEKVNSDLNIKFYVDNMLTFDNGETYDLIYCIGNSLVHLNSQAEILKFLNHIKRRLKPEGKIVIQIINYDRILNQNIDHLPTIYNTDKQLQFIRNYQFDEKNHKILFNTVLKVHNKQFTNTVPLLPIQSYELKELLLKASYKDINFYGDFNFSPYENNDSYALVLHASY